jgi:hypothetical protein
MAEPIVVGEQRSNQRVIRLGAVAVVVLLAAVFLPKVLFGGGGGGEVTEDALPPVASAPATVAEPPPAETFETFASKNPFAPLVDIGSGSGGDTAADSSVPPVDLGVTPPVDGSQVIIVDDGSNLAGGEITPVTGGDTTPTTTVVTAPPRQPDRVSLLEVYSDPGGQTVASVRVNDVTYQVVPRDNFADRYRVLALDLSSRCGDFLFADETFRLCEGDEVSK